MKYAINRGGYDEIKAKARLEEINRNSPGTEAPDFTVTSLDGKSLSLSSIMDKNSLVSLMFYEPDCEHCEQAIASMASNPDLNRLIESGELRFIAVYIGDDYDNWKRHASALPQTWTVCIDLNSEIDEHELYVVMATPSFYLIDNNRRILLKDSNLTQYYNTLSIRF